MDAVELDRQSVELLEHALVVGLLPGAAEPALDRATVALREMVKHVSLLSGGGRRPAPHGIAVRCLVSFQPPKNRA